MPGKASVDYEWNRIADLSGAERQLGRPDLDDSRALWDRESKSLKSPERVERLHERLAVEWAIETGVIERLYTIDRGTTESLIELGLEALERFSSTGRLGMSAARLIEDQRAALAFVFANIKQERPLSISFIRELHQLLCRNQEFYDAVDQFGRKFQAALIKGDWKKLPNNPTRPDGAVHQYCPPECVQDEMESLLHMHDEHVSSRVRPEVEAAWLHHRFTQIHPFQDGNGRVARALATLVFLQGGFLPLVVRNEAHKNLYIDALEAADRGELGPLVDTFANIQSGDIEGAITFIREIRGEGISQIAAAAAGAAKRRTQEHIAQLETATAVLVKACMDRLNEVRFELQSAFAAEGLSLQAAVMTPDQGMEQWWHSQIITAARLHGYFADLGQQRDWVQLRLTLEGVRSPRWNLVVSFHHKEVRSGLMAVEAFLTSTDAGLEGSRPLEVGSTHEFSFSASTRDLVPGFSLWLNDCITALLDRWQARI